MPSFIHLTSALALTSAVIATPVQLEKRKEFSIQQVERTQYLKIGPEQMAKTLRKYGKPVPQHLLIAIDNYSSTFQAAAVGNDTGSAPAVPGDQYDSLYLSPVTVGDSDVMLDFDTGSADLWVFSSLQTQATLTGHDYYTVDSAKEKQGYSWRISYGDGSGASGKVYDDTVVVGGVTATSQAVEAAATVSAQFTRDVDTDGLLGLAMSSINTVRPQQQTTFFDTVLDQLAQPLFAVDLKYHAAGSYDFGFIDESKYTGEINYVDAEIADGFWGVTATAYSIAGTSTSATLPGILDTGTTLLYIDTAVAEAYYAEVSGSEFDEYQGGYVFPCSAPLPDFGVTFGDVEYTIPRDFINYAPLTTGSSTCFGGIQPDPGVGFSIFGDIFLKSVYVIHEMGETPRIGFAQQAGVDV